ncbi:MAG: HAMP domain-containing sensor histidine kinase [Steroidobacteraceae bacterium]
MTLLEHVLSLDLAIDTLLFQEPVGMRATAAPNRMGPPASVCFFLLGIGFWLRVGRAQLHGYAAACGVAVFAIALLSLIGHWYGATAAYAIPRLTGIAFQTVTMLLALSLGLTIACARNEPARTLFAGDSAGMLARRLLPFLIGIPILLGLLRIEGQRQGLFDQTFGTALRTWIEVGMICGIAWWSFRAIRARDRQQSALEAALRDEHSRKDAFLATLSHELRNPLAPIRNSATLLARHTSLGPPYNQAAEIIERHVRHMARLLDELLDLSRLTRGRLELRPTDHDLNSSVAMAIEATRPAIEAAGHEFAITLHPQPIVIAGDPDRLAQVISNLLTNACKYTPQPGRIRLQTTLRLDAAVVTVSDSGAGIDLIQQSKIFELFYQGERRDLSQEGLGVGLWLCKAIAELHGGRIEVASEGLGKGSTFILTLPIFSGNAPQQAR